MANTLPYIERRAAAGDAKQLCPYAHDVFKAGDTLAVCRACSTSHLRESWLENGGCTTYGCENAPDFRKDEPVIRVAIPEASPLAPSGFHSHQSNNPRTPDRHNTLGVATPVYDRGSAASTPSPGARDTETGWLPLDEERRAIITLMGFVLGMSALSSASGWSVVLGFATGILSLFVNVTAKDKRRIAYSAVGLIASLAGLLISAVTT